MLDSKAGRLPERPARAGERGRLSKRALSVYCIIVALYHILYVSGVFSRLGLYIPGVLHRSISLTLIGSLAFILNPLSKGNPRSKLRWVDYALVAMTFGGVGFAAYGYGHLTDLLRLGRIDTISTVMAWITIAVILEGTRRVLGLAMSLVAIVFLLQTMFSNYLPGILEGRGYGFDRMAMQLFVVGDAGIFGIATAVGSTIIVAFMILSAFLQNSGAGSFMIDSALGLFGRVRGGPAKAAVMGSAAFGTISGSTLANVVSTGTITIPLIKRVGYSPHMAGAIEAVASNGGQIMPPVMGTVAFLIAEFLGIPYWQVCLAALIPAILYYAALYFQIDFEAARSGLRGLPREQLPSFRKTFREGWLFAIPILALVVLIGVLQEPPERAAVYAILLLLAVGVFVKKERRMGLKGIPRSLELGTRSSVMVMMACSSASIVIGSLGITNLGIRISAFLIDLSAGNIFILLLLTALVSYIMGFFASSIAIYVTLVLLIAPALVDQGVVPISAHMFVFYWALTSMITPPVCLASYAAASIAGAHPFRVGYTAMKLSIVLYVLPFVWIYFPALVFRGTPLEIASAGMMALLGSAAISAGLAGYMLKPATWFERVPFVVAGLGLLIPMLYLQIGSLAVLAATVFAHWRRRGDVAAVTVRG